MDHPTILINQGTVFENQTVLLTGRRFENCRFLNCTLVWHGPPVSFERCMFGPNIWRVEYTFHDAEHVRAFSDTVLSFALRSLTPGGPEDNGGGRTS